MTVLCIGSINIDHVYRVTSLPTRGETIMIHNHSQGLGGKGANMALAAAKAGAVVRHCGATGTDGAWTIEYLAKHGVDIRDIATIAGQTGHAMIYVDDNADNMIAVYPGANNALTERQISASLDKLMPNDWVLLQNETNLVPYAARQARSRGLNVAYAAAPFNHETIQAVLPHVTLLAVNAIEAEQLSEYFPSGSEPTETRTVLITRGIAGATYRTRDLKIDMHAFQVDAVDTTGAGDTFLGVFVAGLDQGYTPKSALRRATAAAAIQVTRPGAAMAIPTATEIDDFLEQHAKINE